MILKLPTKQVIYKIISFITLLFKVNLVVIIEFAIIWDNYTFLIVLSLGSLM